MLTIIIGIIKQACIDFIANRDQNSREQTFGEFLGEGLIYHEFGLPSNFGQVILNYSRVDLSLAAGTIILAHVNFDPTVLPLVYTLKVNASSGSELIMPIRDIYSALLVYRVNRAAIINLYMEGRNVSPLDMVLINSFINKTFMTKEDCQRVIQDRFQIDDEVSGVIANHFYSNIDLLMSDTSGAVVDPLSYAITMA